MAATKKKPGQKPPKDKPDKGPGPGHDPEEDLDLDDDTPPEEPEEFGAEEVETVDLPPAKPYGGYTGIHRLEVENVHHIHYTGQYSDVVIGNYVFMRPMQGMCTGKFKIDLGPRDTWLANRHQGLKVLSCKPVKAREIFKPEEMTR